jgi:hypothetical protein
VPACSSPSSELPSCSRLRCHVAADTSPCAAPALLVIIALQRCGISRGHRYPSTKCSPGLKHPRPRHLLPSPPTPKTSSPEPSSPSNIPRAPMLHLRSSHSSSHLLTISRAPSLGSTCALASPSPSKFPPPAAISFSPSQPFHICPIPPATTLQHAALSYPAILPISDL